MSDKKRYSLALNDIEENDLEGIKEIFESNSSLFEESILSDYRGDSRFTVMDGTFEVTSITEDSLEFSVEVNFYAGCKDMNDTDTRTGSLDFEVSKGFINFELDETVWPDM